MLRTRQQEDQTIVAVIPPGASVGFLGDCLKRIMRAALASVWPIRSGWNVVRVLSAAILLVAAALKAYQLATEPTIGTSLLEAPWLLMAAVEFELFLAIWLLVGPSSKLTWVAALALFCVLTCISLYKALTGYASCGCFGGVQVNPWFTSALNSIIVLSLLRWRPKKPDQARFEQFFKPAVGVLVLWVAVGLPTAFAVSSWSDTTISDAGVVIGDGKIVVLRPDDLGW